MHYSVELIYTNIHFKSSEVQALEAYTHCLQLTNFTYVCFFSEVTEPNLTVSVYYDKNIAYASALWGRRH